MARERKPSEKKAANKNPRAATTPSRTADVFVSYSHKDTFWKDWLLGDRQDAASVGTIEIWSDSEILPSDDWNTEIREALANAKVALLLVSRNFLDSEFIKNKELPNILRGRAEGSKQVLWVPISPGVHAELAQKLAKLSKIQAAWPPDEPLQDLIGERSVDGLRFVRRQIYDAIAYAVDREAGRMRKTLDSKYEVVRKLGEGASRSVFLGRDHVMKRWVAITALKDHDLLEDFQESLLAASRVDGVEGFATVYDAWPQTSPPYCIRQYVKGETLRDRLRPAGLDYSYALDVLRRLAHALDCAHARGYHHLNIKPSNVMLDEAGKAYLSPLSRRPEFFQRNRIKELYKARYESDEDDKNEDRAYVVPELFGRAVPNLSYAKADQHLLGLLGYHMVTGHLPSRGRTTPRSVHGFARRPLAPIQDRLASVGCPDRLASTIMKMVSAYPDERFETLGQVVERLAGFRSVSVSIVRDSYQRLTESEGAETSLFKAFYKRFLGALAKDRPAAVAKLFDAMEWPRQHQLLKEAILLLLSFAESDAVDQREPNVLSRIRETHRALPGLSAVDYDHFSAALVDVFVARDPRTRDNKEFRIELERAWGKALQPGIDYMSKGPEHWPSPSPRVGRGRRSRSRGVRRSR